MLLLLLFFVFFTSFFISCITLAPSPYGSSFFLLSRSFFDLLIMCIVIMYKLKQVRAHCKTKFSSYLVLPSMFDSSHVCENNCVLKVP